MGHNVNDRPPDDSGDDDDDDDASVQAYSHEQQRRQPPTSPQHPRPTHRGEVLPCCESLKISPPLYQRLPVVHGETPVFHGSDLARHRHHVLEHLIHCCTTLFLSRIQYVSVQKVTILGRTNSIPKVSPKN